MDRLARLFRAPTAADAQTARGTDDVTRGATGPYRSDGGNPQGESDRKSAEGGSEEGGARAVAVVVQAPPAGVRRYELTVRASAAVSAVDPGLLTRHFETFDDATGVVRARAVDVDGNGRTVETETPLFTVRFEAPVDPDTVSVDGTLTGHDEEPVPWSQVRLTPVD